MRPSNRPARTARGFSLLEVLFAIAMLAIGIVAILALFTTGIAQAQWSKNTTMAAMEAQSLATRIVTEVDPAAKDANGQAKRVFIERIIAGKEYIHSDGPETPVIFDENRDLFWKCRALKVASDDTDGDGYPDKGAYSGPAMDPDLPFDSALDYGGKKPVPTTFIKGLYQVTIAIYKNWKPDLVKQQPIITYTTFVTAGY